MRILSFLAGGVAHVGVKLPGGVFDLTAAGYSGDITQTIRDFPALKTDMTALCGAPGAVLLDEQALTYLPPTAPTAKIICVGLNYKLHVDETAKGEAPQYPTTPILFAKFSNALSAHGATVPLSPNAVGYDYEAELVVVMGRGGQDIPAEKAADYIFGYTCGNDLSARDAQQLSSQWLIGKSFPGFAPVGPWIVTADELDPSHLAISCRRGGRLVQSSNTAQMIFDVYTVVSFASKYIRLEPGDLIFTGTPEGVLLGSAGESPDWLKAGDEVAVAIEGIGELTTRFI